VLYRLRSLSEQSPFDAATFSYAFPLLGQVLTQGGVGVEEGDDALEQVALALDIIKFHCGECASYIIIKRRLMSLTMPQLSLGHCIPPNEDNRTTPPRCQTTTQTQ